jgi:hypothetical protein
MSVRTFENLKMPDNICPICRDAGEGEVVARLIGSYGPTRDQNWDLVWYWTWQCLKGHVYRNAEYL